jgi:hypothetical protein
MERAGKGNELSGTATPEQLRQDFESTYAAYFQGELQYENQYGSRATVACYEMIVDPIDRQDRRHLVNEFGLRAVQAGYRQAMSPVVLPEVGFRDPVGRQPLVSVSYFLEKPPVPPARTTRRVVTLG